MCDYSVTMLDQLALKYGEKAQKAQTEQELYYWLDKADRVNKLIDRLIKEEER